MLLDSKNCDHEPVHPSAGFTNDLPNVLMINLKKLKCYLKNTKIYIFGKLKCFFTDIEIKFRFVFNFVATLRFI